MGRPLLAGFGVCLLVSMSSGPVTLVGEALPEDSDKAPPPSRPETLEAKVQR